MKKIIFLLFFIFAPSAHAQSISLSVSPPVVEIMLAPNKQVSQTFTLKTTGENVNVIPELHLVKPSDSSGHMEIDLNPLIPSTIPLTINITGPNNMPTLTFETANTDIPQDIYLALVFRTVGAGSSRPSNTTLSPAISSLILVTINPSDVIPINLEVRDFSPPFFHDSWLPLTISPIIDNKVGIMIRPQGLYEVIDPSGKTIFSLSLYPNLILGNSSRRILGSSSTSEVKGALTSEVLTWSPKWSNIGPHRLRLTITTTGGTQISQVERIVWILPIRIIVLTTLFLILFIIFLVTRRNSHTHTP